MTCPDCGHEMVLVKDKYGKLWKCTSCPYDQVSK